VISRFQSSLSEFLLSFVPHRFNNGIEVSFLMPPDWEKLTMRLASSRMISFIGTHLTLCTLLMTGCGEPHYQSGLSPSHEQEHVDSPVPESPGKLAELSRRLEQRSEIEIQQLADLLEFDPVTSSSSGSRLEGTLRDIADELLTLTLEEADRLGALLAEQSGATALPVSIADRQFKARKAVEKIQQRLTEVPEGWNPGDVFIANALVTEPLDLPWLQARTDRQYEQVTGLSFVREEYDLGPTETDLSDEEMKYVGMLTGLRRLDLRESQVTGRGLYALRYLQRLETLDVRRINAALPGWKTLASLTSLRELKLQPVEPNIADCGWTGQLPHLEVLVAHDVVLDENDLAVLCRNRSLRELHLATANPDPIVTLQDLPRLGELHLTIHSPDATSPAGIRLAHLPRLKYLNIYVTRDRDDPGPSRLQPFELVDLPHLERVNLAADSLSSDGLASLGRLPSLQTLWMVSMTIPGESFRLLEDLDEITYLHCTTDDGDRALQSLSHLQTLKHLSLFAEEITTDGLQAVSQLSELESLHLTHPRMAGDAAPYISKLKNLKDLTLGDGTVPKFQLREHPTLESIRLLMVQAGEVRLENLLKLRRFEFNRGEFSQLELRHLPELNWCDVKTVRPARVQSVHLADLPHLSHFQLGPITPGGSIEQPSEPIAVGDEFIAQFKPMERLQMLWLRNVLVTDAGLLQLGHLLQLGSREFSGPYITKEGRSRLTEAIEEGRRQARAQRNGGR
jgi:hypothetical protein